jgi:hypothetical protein
MTACSEARKPRFCSSRGSVESFRLRLYYLRISARGVRKVVTYTGKDGLQHWEHRRTCIVVFILHKSEHDGEDLLQQSGTFRSNLISGSILGVGSGQ